VRIAFREDNPGPTFARLHMHMRSGNLPSSSGERELGESHAKSLGCEVSH
jgi:hypothetical protein